MRCDWRGLSPIVATVILIGLTVAAAVPLSVFFSSMYSPARPRRTDVQVFAGLINENIVRFNIQHIGGETISNPSDLIRGRVGVTGISGLENDMYCWTFENPLRFRQSDWMRAEVQLHGVSLKIGDVLEVNIWAVGRGSLYTGQVTIDDLSRLPG